MFRDQNSTPTPGRKCEAQSSLAWLATPRHFYITLHSSCLHDIGAGKMQGASRSMLLKATLTLIPYSLVSCATLPLTTSYRHLSVATLCLKKLLELVFHPSQVTGSIDLLTFVTKCWARGSAAGSFSDPAQPSQLSHFYGVRSSAKMQACQRKMKHFVIVESNKI